MIGLDTAERLEPILRAFEAAWADGRPSLSAFLPDDPADRPATARELALLDMECRASAGLSAAVEEYLSAVPELAADTDAVAELVAAEFRLAHRAAGVREEDFVERFPDHREAIAARLGVRDDAPAGPVRSGTRLGRYLLHEVLGRGAFGTVFRATDAGLGRAVAVKVLRDAAPGAGQVGRFLHEARRAGRLRHPNLIPVFDAGVCGGVWYLVSEYVPGRTLAAVASAGPLPPRDAADTVAQLADALDHAHAAGVVHRDVKPANVLVGADGRPRLTDFGLAVGPAGSSGGGLGTPGYLPPEAAAGAPPAPAGDVYSLGAVLYELLTGRPPYLPGPPAEVLRRQAEADPPPPRTVRPSVPRDLDIVCRTALHRDPGRRYASAAALAADLRRWAAGEFVLARPPGAGERLAKWGRRNPARAGLSFALLVVVLAAGGLIGGQWRAAVVARQRAEESFHTAHQAVARLAAVGVGGEGMEGSAAAYPRHREVIRYYQAFLAERGDDPALRRELAAAHWAVAQHATAIGRPADAHRHALDAWHLYRRLDPLPAADEPAAVTAALLAGEREPEPRAWAVTRAADRLTTDPHDWAARAAFVRGRLLAGGPIDPALLAPLLAAAPTDPAEVRTVIDACLSAAGLARNRDPEPAAALFRRAAALADRLAATGRPADLVVAAVAEHAAGEFTYNALRQPAHGRPHFARAADYWERVRATGPLDPDQAWAAATTEYHLGLIDNTPAARAAAVAALRRSLPPAARLLAAHPDAREYRRRLGAAYHLIGKLADPDTDGDRLDWYQQAAAVRATLCDDPDATDDDRTDHGLSLGRVGAVCLLRNRPAEAAAALTAAIRLFEELAARHPSDLRFPRHLWQCRADLDRTCAP